MLASQATYPSVLALNAILLEAPEALTTSYSDVLVDLIAKGIKNSVRQHSLLCILQIQPLTCSRTRSYQRVS